MTDNTARQEAYARGLNHGWDAANYAEAYGGESAASEADRRARNNYAGDELDAYLLRDSYVSGYETGWQRYEDGQYPDGATIED